MYGKTGVFAARPIPETAPVVEPEPSPVELQMLAEIRERPDDDGPRVVYADLLSMRNDPRGEFITAGVNGNQQRVSGLWSLHQAAWTKKLPSWAEYPEFDRGFVSAIQLDGSLDDLRDNERWRAVLSLSPVPAVKLRSRGRGTSGQCIDVYFRHDGRVAAILDCRYAAPEHRITVVELPSWKPVVERRYQVNLPNDYCLDPIGDQARVRFVPGDQLTYLLVRGKSPRPTTPTYACELTFSLDQAI